MDNEDKKDENPAEVKPNDDQAELTDQEKQQETAAAGIVPGLIDREITNEVQTAFLSYSMSVIESRAIPDVRDGLKPVQRRIIFGMNESGMQPGKPYKKSARIVGDVMGKYHPHGDAALYLTLVRLAQPFSLRYTLVDGHGNFGSVDGDEPAAMRYTEARMNKLAVEMVRDLDKDTVDFVDNYDGTEKEPSVLPSRFPNLLVNGSEGIAVGMATNMPPHNLTESINAIEAMCHNPALTPMEIMQNYLHGPDFPTGGVILGRQGILDYFTTGTGTVTIRSKYHIEEEDSRLCFYDKVKEQRNHKEPIPELYKHGHCLRYEQRYTSRLPNQLGVPGVTANMLYDEAFYCNLLQRWRDTYLDIIKINDTQINISAMKNKTDLYKAGILALIEKAGGLSQMKSQIKEAYQMGKITKKQSFDLRRAIDEAAKCDGNITTPNEAILELDEKVRQAVKFFR
jgi:hypothetical protein